MRTNKIDTIVNLSEEQKKIIMDEIAYFFLKISKVNSTVRLCGGINSRISRVYYFTH